MKGRKEKFKGKLCYRGKVEISGEMTGIKKKEEERESKEGERARNSVTFFLCSDLRG